MANESIEVLEVFDKLETSCSKTYNNLVNEYLEIRAGRAITIRRRLLIK